MAMDLGGRTLFLRFAASGQRGEQARILNFSKITINSEARLGKHQPGEKKALLAKLATMAVSKANHICSDNMKLTEDYPVLRAGYLTWY